MKKEHYFSILEFIPYSVAVFNSVDGGEDFVGVWANSFLFERESKLGSKVIGLSLRQLGHQKLLFACQRVYDSREIGVFSWEHFEDSRILEVTIVPGGSDDLILLYRDSSEQNQLFPAGDYSWQLLTSLFNATPDWIFIKDKEFRFLFLNEGFARALNRKVSDLLGKNDEEAGFPKNMIYGDQAQGIRGFRFDDAEVLETGQTIHNPYDPATFADGSVHIFDTRKMPVYDAQKKICGVLGIARDITKRKETEDALAKSEKLFRALLEATHDAAMLVSVEGELLAMNGRCKGLFPRLLVGNGVFDIALFSKEMLAKIASQEDVFWVKSEYIGERVYDITYHPVLDDLEQTYQIAIFIRDMTNEVRLAEQLRQSEKMRAIGHLAGGIAHDFNNQLAGIVGYLELLESHLQSEKLIRYAKNALRGANRAADLTRQLLAFSRKGKNLSVIINLHEIVEEVVAILERSLDKRIKINISSSDKCLCTSGDPTQIQNAILNLALNARDAMLEGGKLSIRSEPVFLDSAFCSESSFDICPGQYIQVIVEDNGIGMSKEVQGRIFEPFYTTKPEGRGVGMGLSAVYGTVNNHNGAIVVSSELEKGTSVSLFFPVGESCLKEMPAKKMHRKQEQGNIIVVDDEELVADIASEMLEELGYNVTIFYNGKDALSFFRKYHQQIDLVVFDMVMPNMNGKELFRELVAINSNVKGIIISGYGIDGQIQEVIDMGAKGFIAKPFTFDELSIEVKKYTS